MLRRVVLSLLAVSLLSLAPRAVAAQFGLERVIGNITEASLNSQTSCLLNTSALKPVKGENCGLYGWSVEVALGLSPDSAPTQFQFAVSYGQIAGFGSADPSYDMRGVMRLAPEVSFYATRVVNDWFMPYVGVHTGIATLNNVQVYTTPGDTISTFSANTMQFGATAGLFLPFNLYVDVGFRYRDFRALEWRLPRGVLPPTFPKAIIMNALQITAGYQFDVGSLTGRKK
jgi:opacity protein-like surface antigen